MLLVTSYPDARAAGSGVLTGAGALVGISSGEKSSEGGIVVPIEAVDAALRDIVRSGSVVEKLYREIRALRIYEGASDVQKVIIARQTLGGN